MSGSSGTATEAALGGSTARSGSGAVRPEERGAGACVEGDSAGVASGAVAVFTSVKVELGVSGAAAGASGNVRGL